MGLKIKIYKPVYKTLCALVSLLTAFNVCAQELVSPTTLQVKGEVRSPLSLRLQDIALFRQAEVSANDKAGKPHLYSGVSLLSVLDSAGVDLGKKLRGEHLRKYVLVKCADGYQVLFSLAELDPDFGNQTVLLAVKMDGKPLPQDRGTFRLVVPGDKALARSSFKVVEIVVATAKD